MSLSNILQRIALLLLIITFMGGQDFSRATNISTYYPALDDKALDTSNNIDPTDPGQPQWPASMVSGYLPVIYINTVDGVSIPDTKDEYINAVYWLDNMGLEGLQSFGSEDKPLELGIRRRGNSTWVLFDKKPYKIKLDKKAALLNMPANKHWALMAHADGGYGCNFFHDAVGFEASRIFELEWTPTEKPIELVLNGEYMGIYFLCETIRVDKNRLNISEQDDMEDDLSKIEEGGWLVELDNYASDIRIIEKNEAQSVIYFTPDTPELLSDAQRSFLLEQLNDINDAIYADNLYSNRLFEIVDVVSLAKYYIIQELLFNWDGFCGSTYFYRRGNGDEKWYWGPAWDFGNCMTITQNRDIDGWVYQKSAYNVRWIQQIVNHPQFINTFKQQWMIYSDQLVEGLSTCIDTIASQIYNSTTQDHTRWLGLRACSLNKPDDLLTAADVVKQRLVSRQQFLNDQWANGFNYSFSVTNNEFASDLYAYGWCETNNENLLEFLGEWPGTLLQSNETTNDYHCGFITDSFLENAHILFHCGVNNRDDEVSNSLYVFDFCNGQDYNLSNYSDVANDLADTSPIYTIEHSSITSHQNIIVYDVVGVAKAFLGPEESVELPGGFYIIKAATSSSIAHIKPLN